MNIAAGIWICCAFEAIDFAVRELINESMDDLI